MRSWKPKDGTLISTCVQYYSHNNTKYTILWPQALVTNVLRQWKQHVGRGDKLFFILLCNDLQVCWQGSSWDDQSDIETNFAKMISSSVPAVSDSDVSLSRRNCLVCLRSKTPSPYFAWLPMVKETQQIMPRTSMTGCRRMTMKTSPD